MARPFPPTDLPERFARLAEAEVAAGHFASIEDVVKAGLEAGLTMLQQRQADHPANGQANAPAAPGKPAPFWETFTQQVHALPDEVFERLPEDGASEHDHYLYGAPKRRA
jgi:Arc/MetJ-type ribon-helix-helix transcriptional regulator